MSMKLPVTYDRPQHPTGVPLGTAGWLNFKDSNKPLYIAGDLWLGRLPTNEAVGYSDDRHVLLVSGTRAGKGASIIIPNLCLWPGSAVVIDPKGENAVVTARRRANGSAWAKGQMQKVHILDPFRETATAHDDFADLRASYNPLDLLQTNGDDAVDDAARIADALIVSEGSHEPFFDDSAKGVLKALLLHINSSLDYPNEKRNLLTLRNILLAGDDEMRRLMQMNGDDTCSGMGLLFKAMQRNPAYYGIVANAGAMYAELLESSPRTLMSVLQVARTNTDFLDSPLLRSCLKSSSFQLADLKHKPTTLYLCLPQRFMGSHYRWLRMMTTLIIGEMERIRPTPAPKHPILMVLDEFPALGRMQVIENAAAQIAGYGVKLMFVSQTLAQLKDIYKDNWETLVANAGLKLFFGNDDHFTRDYVSKLIGEIEVKRWTVTHSTTKGTSISHGYGQHKSKSHGINSSVTYNSGWSGDHFNSSRSTSSGSNFGWSSGTSINNGVGSNENHTQGSNETLHKRPLLTPDEVGRLFGNREQPALLVLASGLQPLALKRSSYFSDEQFMALYDPHPDHSPPMTLSAREQVQQLKEIYIDLRDRLRVEFAANEARERKEQQARLAQAKAKAIADQRKRRIAARIRRCIQIGFIVALSWGFTQYPPTTKLLENMTPIFWIK